MYFILVFFTMNVEKGCSRLVYPKIPDCLENSSGFKCLNCVLCCIPEKVLWPLGFWLWSLASVLPIPVFTSIYRFYLEVGCHTARSQENFKEKILHIEKESRDYKALGKL